MPRRGENIRKRKDGRWEGRYYVLDLNGVKMAKSVYGKSYLEAKEKLAEAKQNIHSQPAGKAVTCTAAGNNITFGAVATEWLSDISDNKKHSTYIKYKTIYQKHLEDNISNELLSDIDSERIVNLVSAAARKSDSLCKSIYCVVNQIFEYATTHYHMPSIKVSHKKNRSIIKPVEVFSQREQRQLMQLLYTDMDTNKFGIVLCLSTGLRLGEVCALKWSDIDLQEKVLYVNRTVQRIEADGYDTKTILLEGEPKSIFSKREIPLSDEIIQLMSRFDKNREYVISARRPTEPRTYQNRFQKYLRLAGIDKTNFHVLRHTFATNCINAGADIKSLSEILGHSDVNITLNRYVHPTLDTKRQHLNSLSAIYGQYVGQLCS